MRLRLSVSILTVLASLLLTPTTAIANSDTKSTLQAGFINPPITARPGAFWNWLNGNTDRNRIRYDLQQMKAKGMSGAEIWDVAAIRNGDQIPAGPEFLGEESAATIRFALAEARKLGLRMGIITSSGWNAGGTWVQPDWATKCLVWSTTETTGPITFGAALPYPTLPKSCPVDANGKPIFAREIAVVAVPASADKILPGLDSAIDLTGKLTADGTLKWDVPAGPWRIIRFVCTNTGQHLIVPSPKSNGLMIDFLDPQATIRHLQTIMDRLQITPHNAAESGLNYMEVDSMELEEGTVWTDKFVQEFRHYRGYDCTQWLPVLAGYTVKDKPTTDRFLYDLRNTVSDLLIHSHYETGHEFLAKYGMEFVGEAGGPGPPIWNTCPVDALKALGAIDVPRGEFWIQHRNMFLIKEIASASHTYGKSIVDAESFTTWRRWEDSPFILKMSADRAFAEGLNRLTIHGFAHSPDSAGLPGRVYHAGIDINPNTTWWPYARPFMDYLARCSYLLQQGQPVADVLWYYGDQAPNFFPLFHDVPKKPRITGLGRGYDYDVINSEVILNRLKVENGRFVLPEGTSYTMLAFPPEAAMPVEVLQKLQDLVKQGGIISGPLPKHQPGYLDYESKTKQLHEIASEMWGSRADGNSAAPNTYGKGKVYNTSSTLDGILTENDIQPDVTFAGVPAEDLDYIHRVTADQHIYFLCNSTTGPVTFDASFRVQSSQAELWNPSTGKSKPVTANVVSNRTSITLTLDSGGSIFVVFPTNPNAQSIPPTATTPSDHNADTAIKSVNSQNFNFQPLEWKQEISNPVIRGFDHPWLITFPPDSCAPTSTTLTKLKSWTDIKKPGIRYFSGTATYTNTFTVPPELFPPAHISSPDLSERVILDLGQVFDVAEIEINGQSAGINWKPPYTTDITNQLRPGKNEITLRITNQWHNRLVGDAQTTTSKRITKTNLPLPDKATTPLPSGLIGPVTFTKD